MQVPERQIYAFSGPRHSFLAAGEQFGCEKMILTGAGIHLKGKNSCIYFPCILFLRSGCSNLERAKYLCRLETGILRADTLLDSPHSSAKALHSWPEHRGLTLSVVPVLAFNNLWHHLWSTLPKDFSPDQQDAVVHQPLSLWGWSPLSSSSNKQRVRHLSCNLLCYPRPAWARTASPSPGQLKRCKWQRKVGEISQLDLVKAR